ncbi:MAG: thioredoxin family protein [candidate division WOR-3 bacterium]|nr:thioredoxin family protein [candidate division WOR-3 bacterium]
MIKELTDIDFFQEVEKSSMPYLVYFWAIWSPTCKAMSKYIEEIDKKYSDKIKIGKVNVDNEIKTANMYDIQNIPTILIFEGGSVKERIIGTITKEVLLKKLNRYLGTKSKKQRG